MTETGPQHQPAGDPLHEQWVRSPENLRSRGLYQAIVLPGAVFVYAGAALLALTIAQNDAAIEIAGSTAAVLVGLGLVGFALAHRSEARAAFYERQEQAARRGVDEALEDLGHETDLPGLLRLNRRQMEQYETLTRRQAASSYRLSHVALAVGLTVIIAGGVSAIVVNGESTRIVAASLAVAAGAISSFVANTYLRIYERTLLQLNRYFQQPLASSYILTAERLIDKMSPDRKDEALAKVIVELFAWRGDAPESRPRRFPRRAVKAKDGSEPSA
jgi:hypothetical protein